MSMPLANEKNPGTVNPADQSYPAPSSAATSSPSSAPLVSSTGELQLPYAGPTVAQPSACLGLAAEVHVANGSVSRASLPADAVVTGTGLPAEVHAESACFVRSLPADVALPLPVATNTSADTRSPGGLAPTHMIR